MRMAKMPIYKNYNYNVINTFPSYKMSIITIILKIKILKLRRAEGWVFMKSLK